MYSGQGSQYFQMGRSLYENNTVFKDSMIKADHLFQEMAGFSIIEQLYNDKTTKSEPFSSAISSPAIFMVEYALTQALKEKNIVPSLVLGTSIGEFAAAVTAGILSFETSLLSLSKQVEVWEKYYNSTGGMLAILHDPSLYQSAWLKDHCELAAINFPSNFVVSGTNENLLEITKKLQEENIIFQMLPVSQAYHSSLMDPAKEAWLQTVKTMTINEPIIPFFSCEQSSLMTSIPYTHFWEAIRNPILFRESISILEKEQPAIYIDIGSSGTLATFVKYNLSSISSSRYFQIMTPYGDDINSFNQLVAYLQK